MQTWKRIGLLLCGACGLGCQYSGRYHGSPRYTPASAVDPTPGESASESPSESPGVASTTASPRPIDRGHDNPFFQSLGTNGRACATCHHEDQGWTLTPQFAHRADPDSPLFLFDGSDCLGPGVPNTDPGRESTELLEFGNIRIELPIPPDADYVLLEATDPLHCATPASSSGLRMYRRPLPIANSAFLGTVMWDGREEAAPSIRANLEHQANTAALVHARVARPLPQMTRAQLVDFVTSVFHAERRVGDLDLARGGAHGGPAFLFSDVLPQFRPGMNDPFEAGFSGAVFDLYRVWEPGVSTEAPTPLAASIGRGEAIFNTKPLTITDVPGLNGPHDASREPLRFSCSTCHNNPNVGNHTGPFSVDIGVTATNAADLDVAHLPTYTFQEKGTGHTTKLTDPGRGAITGRFSDLGKTKVPNLRGLGARAPYFHNGSARDLSSVVQFYDERFNAQLTTQEKSDLEAFLRAL